MKGIISKDRAEKNISRYEGWIEEVAERYSIPKAAIKAILFKEMTMIDIMDVFADLVVLTRLFGKKDSSTGYAQIFGKTGLDAVNFAEDHGLSDREKLGLGKGPRLDRTNINDIRKVWRLLRSDRRANIEIASLNILSAAEEMTGRTDFGSFSEEELKLVFTRYNANTKKITPYGEDVYRHFLRYGGRQGSAEADPGQ